MKAYFYESREVNDLQEVYYNELADLTLYYSDIEKAYFSHEPYSNDLELIYDNGERDDKSAIALFDWLCLELLEPEGPTGWTPEEVANFEREIDLFLLQV